MIDVELCTTTGIERVDNLLLGLIALFELSFPARIRSYYLGGSYSDGTAVGHDRSPNSSDVDLFVIFRGTIEETEHATFEHIVAACRLISPLPLDAHGYSEDDLLQRPGKEAPQSSFLNALIKVAGLLIYGDDMGALLPPVPYSRYVLDVIESAVFHLGIPRQREELAYPLREPLVPPLTYPDPVGEFYGYDVVPARPDAPSATRVLVAITTWIATLLLALETGRYAGQKSQSIQLCKAYLPNDKRTRLAAIINDTCKGAWGYRLPGDAEDRKRLRDWCRDTLDLENEFLRLCRHYVLAQLQQGGVEEKRRATRILQSVVYCDTEMMAILKTLAHATDEGTRSGAAQALAIMESSS